MIPIKPFLWIALAIAAGPAHAHAPVPGIEGFYVGLLHPFSTPSQALLILGLGLVTGALPVDRARWVLASFVAAMLVGLIAGPVVSSPDQVLFAAATIASALAALAPGRLAPLAILLAALGGYLIGELSIPDEGPLNDRLFTMSGSFVGAGLGLLYVFGIVNFVGERYTKPWVGIALRVIAAWIGAVSLLMLALSSVEVAPPV